MNVAEIKHDLKLVSECVNKSNKYAYKEAWKNVRAYVTPKLNKDLEGQKPTTNSASLAIALWKRVVEISQESTSPENACAMLSVLIDEWNSATAGE